MAFDFSTLITDRSPEDLQALQDLLATPMADWTAEQLAEFNLAVSKGAYNYTDLNRVTACMDYLNEVLTGLGYVTGYQRVVVPHQEPEPVGPLPEGYTQLEYIESTGTQYIDTGYIPNQDSRITIKAVPMSSAETGDGSGFIPYGAGISNSSKAFECYSSLGQYEFNYDGQYSFVGSASVGSVLEIDHNKNIVSLCSNGEKQNINFTYATFSCPYTLTLFALHRASILRGLLRLYSCQIYDNGTITRYFVPCKNPYGEVGLYDLVSNVFFGNAGTGSFIAGPEPGVLPDGYTELEYIRGTGTQYIDTQFQPNQDTKVVIDIVGPPANTTARYLISAQNGSIVYQMMSQHGGTQVYDYYGTSAQIVGGIPTTSRIILDKDKNHFSAGTVSFTHPTGNFSVGYNLYIFAQNNRGSTDQTRIAQMDLYSCKIYNNDTLARDFVPCKDASNVVGLYDLVNCMFYQNVGTGTFTAGPEVQPPESTPDPEPEPVLDPYTWYESDTPTQEQMTQYLANVEALKRTLTLADNAPELPSDMDGLTTQAANHIEEILSMINLYLLVLQRVFLRSGMAWAVSGGPGFYFAN